MIKSLQIKNYALIERLEIDFSRGLTVITGETGAGKSILLGALGLVMGKRADTKVLYHDDKKCIVEAVFDIRKYHLKAFFGLYDIDYDEELVIRREITPSGKSRAFVNDTPVNLKILQQLSASLIDLHQQFDSRDIHNVSFQLRMIDALAGNSVILKQYQQQFRQYQSDKKKLRDLLSRSENATKESGFLDFQLEEFNNTALLEGEQEQLEEELAKLNNAEDIKRTLAAAFRQLSESEPSVLDQLGDIGLSLGNLAKFDALLGDLHERFHSIILNLQDLSQEIEKLAEKTEYDAEKIVDIQQRLDLIYRLENKHNATTVAELIDIQNELQAQLDAIADLSSEIKALEASIDEQAAGLNKLAGELSERRKAVVGPFEQKVLEMLAQLGMEHSSIQVGIHPLEELSLTGSDEIHFLFSANKGERLQLVRDVASGGELSRLTLVTKSLVASSIPLPTLIFDEIDSGISGSVALKMGNILRLLSNQHQVVTITHSPQVASKADSHYLVYKKIKNERTVTKVLQLTQDERVRAIATMLSQSPPSESAMENARELLKFII